MTILAVRHIEDRGDYAVLDGDAQPGEVYDVITVIPRYPLATLRVLSGGAFPIAQVERVHNGVSLEGLQGREVQRARR